ncbi:MAG TPA: iron ABC transporter permease [Woeseiaceae bacterium]
MPSGGTTRAAVQPTQGRNGNGLSLLVLVFAFVASLPLLVVILSFLGGAGDVWPHLARYVLPQAFSNTLWLAAGVAIGTATIGVSLAWFVAACEFPGRRFFSWAMLLPMAMPGYVLGFAFLAMFEYTGPVQGGWRQLFGSSQNFPDIGARGAAIVTLTLTLYPYVYLIVREAFASQGIRGLEVARSAGFRPLQGFFRVTLPMARPWIVAGVSLAVMESLADFGTVKLFNYQTFTTAIYRAWYGLFSLQSALQLSLVLVVLVLFALLLERRLRGRARYTDPGTARQSRRIILSAGRAWSVSFFCSAILLIAFGLPAGLIVIWSIENFALEFDSGYWQLIANTLMLAGFAAMFITAVAILLGFTVRRSPGVLNRSLARVATLGYAIPGAVLAVGFFVPVAWLSRALNQMLVGDGGTIIALQSGLFVIFLAYLARFLAVAHGPVESALQRIRPSVEEAARGMGVSGLRLLGRVHLPILRPAILTAALLVFVDLMKELPITLMTRPFGWDTLAVRVFQLTTEGEWERAAMPAVAIVIAGLLPVILLTRRRY